MLVVVVCCCEQYNSPHSIKINTLWHWTQNAPSICIWLVHKQIMNGMTDQEVANAVAEKVLGSYDALPQNGKPIKSQFTCLSGERSDDFSYVRSALLSPFF